jgi:hypothetical protein
MRIVFFMRNFWYVRNFEAIIRELAARGHNVMIVFDNKKLELAEKAGRAYLDTMCAQIDNITYDYLIPPNPFKSLQAFASRTVRLHQDYMRYLGPALRNAVKTRERAGIFLGPLARLTLNAIGRNQRLSRAWRRTLSRLDDLIPAPSYIMAFLHSAKPDVILVTPLFSHGSYQADYFKASKQLGIPSCLPVASWDNLTSKGLVHASPDRVLVWNEAQRQEAVELQGIASKSVVTTGAHSFDHWFAWKPSTTRREFLSTIGLSPDEPYILYLGSSFFIAGHESAIVLNWASALRKSQDPLLRKVGILIRPHPQNIASWSKIDVSVLGNAVIYPRLGANPVGHDARSEYYDSIYHSRIVFGINTSGMIEAGILGKPVHTVLFEEMQATQEGLPHFHHLSAPEGGLLHISQTLTEHLAKLGAALRTESEVDVRSQTFVRRFVRPPELAKTPTKYCADVIEELAAGRAPVRKRASLRTALLQTTAAPLLLLMLVQPKYIRSKFLQPLSRFVKVQTLPAVRFGQSFWQPAGQTLMRKFLPMINQRRIFRKRRQSTRANRSSEVAPSAKILLLLRDAQCLANLGSLIRGLLDRGCRVHISFEERMRSREDLDALRSLHPRLAADHGEFPRRSDAWGRISASLRSTADHFRHLDRRYRQSDHLRKRAAAVLPRWLRFLDLLPSLPSPAIGTLRRVCAGAERLIPSAKVVEDRLMKISPDVMIVSPLVNARSAQHDAVKAARALEIRTALVVSDWDDLSTKGFIHMQPEKVLVWNSMQRTEAVDCLGVAPEEVTVIGPLCIDDWSNGAAPARSREEFCRQAGFAEARPFILFAGSKYTRNADAELAFARRWLQAVRRTNGPLVTFGIVVQPHPRNCLHWRGTQIADGDSNTVVFPSRGDNTANERQVQFYAQYYASAVVGWDAGVMVDAALLGKPALTVIDKSIADTQQDLLHFHRQLPESATFLTVAKSLEEHVGDLNRIVANGATAPNRLSEFVPGFAHSSRPTEVAIRLLETMAEDPFREEISFSKRELWAGEVLEES